MGTLQSEFLKAVPGFTLSLLTIVLGWFVGQKLTVRWNLYQKRRESDLASAETFHKLYGEFFAVWKLWNYSLDPKDGCTVTRSDLLVRACTSEGNMESLFVRISANRNLKDDEIAVLSRFRQGYQSLRESIRDNRGLDWYSSEHQEYKAFKILANEVAQIIIESDFHGVREDSVKKRAESLIGITANTWEDNWFKYSGKSA